MVHAEQRMAKLARAEEAWTVVHAEHIVSLEEYYD